jgi:deoxycytidine triphosphate deaminase
MGFSKNDLDALLDNPTNAYLKEKTEAERYNDFSKVDPFPKIPSSLLNSKDIIQYVLTTGMINPFNPEDVEGATYRCRFSGEFIYWDEDRIKHRKIVTGDDPLLIKPNSVMFLGLEPTFRIPEYLILRFNLRVKNAYKGLLLGTGPIVDPGYTGRLFIPLHNLTSNNYCIKIKAHLIDVEFTKLSNNDKWKLDAAHKSIVNALDFDDIRYVPKEKYDINRDIDKYIEASLTADSLFAIANIETPFVNSSMAEEIKKMEAMQISTDNKIAESDKKIKELDYLKKFSILTTCSVIIAAISLFAATCWYFHNEKKIPETQQKITEQQIIVDQQKNDFDEYKSDTQTIINELESRIQILEGREP